MTAAHRALHVGVQRSLRQFSSTSQQPYDVCIVGGGMVGMALAAALGTPLLIATRSSGAVGTWLQGETAEPRRYLFRDVKLHKGLWCVQEQTAWPSTCRWWCWTAPL
jgi:hypothetical protein